MTTEWDQLPQKDRDHQVSPSAYSNRYSQDEIVERFISAVTIGSEAAQSCIRHECDIPYGDGKKQTINIFWPDIQQEDSPVLVFFHGGYWQHLSKEDHGLVAIHPTRKGAIVALVGYTIAPQGTVPQMVIEAEQAVVFLAQKFPKARFYVSGHSCGGHLAAMLLTVDWSKKHGLPKDFIRGAFLLSGVFDVRPLVKTYVNEPLNLTEEEAYRISPIAPQNLERATQLSSHCQVVNMCGEHDPKYFQEMSEDYTKALSDGGLDAVCEVISGMDHFEPMERLVEASNQVTETLLQLLFP